MSTNVSLRNRNLWGEFSLLTREQKIGPEQIERTEMPHPNSEGECLFPIFREKVDL